MRTAFATARRPARPPAAAWAVALTLTIQLVGSWSAPPASAADPAPADPTPAPLESPATSTEPAPSPADTASPDPTVDPASTPAPTLTPDPVAEPAPTPDPGPLPSADPSMEPSAPPAPEPTASPIPWTLSAGQQQGMTTSDPLPLYRLEAATSDPVAPTAVHTGVGLSGPDCAACHSTHRGDASELLNEPEPRSGLCLSCHSGSGSPYDVASQLGGTPVNDPSTDSYYRHLIEAGSGRQVTCTACHNPHDATAQRPAMATTGWTASGAILGADGVAVTNGVAGSAPAYAPISRSIGGGSLVYEYQLCLACHTGAATLLGATATHPSWWALDKGIELNPANASYHPIEAQGRNQSTQMAASLAGTSPFKAWTYGVDATIRCTSCHGDPATVDQTATASPKQPAADAREASHASSNRGILIAPYRDRILKSAGEPYSAGDFALCYLCHAEAAFTNPNQDPESPVTAFSLHGFHITQLYGLEGGGTSIDTAGAGEGLAICAECHFRIHSTAIAYKAGDLGPIARSSGSGGLVNFAPNVVGPASTGPVWNQPGSNGIGSCTLTCHAKPHNTFSASYGTAPGTGFAASLTAGPVGPNGLTIQFADETRYISPSGATWLWTFGDGATATEQNPLHVYLAPGTYTVSLTVTRTSDGYTATMTKPSYISVTP